MDYNETLDPVVHLEAIRIILAFAVSKGFKLFLQMDVKNAFLNDYEKMYVRQHLVLKIPSFQVIFLNSKNLL